MDILAQADLFLFIRIFKECVSFTVRLIYLVCIFNI